MNGSISEARRPGRRNVLLVLASLVWAAAVVVGLGQMWSYENRPGSPGVAPVHLRANWKPSLIVFAHPRCPCTGATVDELTELVARAGDGLSTRVYFYYPRAKGESWTRTELWQRVSAIKGVESIADPDGAEARRLGAKTSGQAVLYGADGTLLFSGGLTDSRGHSGESSGRRAVLALLANPRLAHAATPVFGCPILRTAISTEGLPTRWPSKAH